MEVEGVETKNKNELNSDEGKKGIRRSRRVIGGGEERRGVRARRRGREGAWRRGRSDEDKAEQGF